MGSGRQFRGFSLVELVIVMAVIALILSIAIPNFRSMQQDANLTRAEGDLETLKMAVVSYWRQADFVWPANLHSALTSATPAVITETLNDPWLTDSTNKTYGFLTGTDPVFGPYFMVYTKGPLADTLPTWDGPNQKVTYTGTGRVMSNAPVERN